MRSRLIRHMLEGKGNFPPDNFDGVPEVCIDLAQKLFKEGQFHNAINIFEAGEKVDNKLGRKTHDWIRTSLNHMKVKESEERNRFGGHLLSKPLNYKKSRDNSSARLRRSMNSYV